VPGHEPGNESRMTGTDTAAGRGQEPRCAPVFLERDLYISLPSGSFLSIRGKTEARVRSERYRSSRNLLHRVRQDPGPPSKGLLLAARIASVTWFRSSADKTAHLAFNFALRPARRARSSL